MTTLTSDYFDEWYRASNTSPHDGLASRLLGLPDGLRSNSSLGGPGLDEVIGMLGEIAGQTVIDLGCGRGQLGLEVHRRTGCRLIGIDFSAVAVTTAREHARLHGAAPDDVRFEVGDLSATGLPTGAADAVLSIDALCFARPREAGAAECARVLRPGGRLVTTSWELVEGEAKLPRALALAGFDDIVTEDRPDWAALERRRWLAIAGLPADGDAMLAADQREAEAVLARWDQQRRVLISAISGDGADGRTRSLPA